MQSCFCAIIYSWYFNRVLIRTFPSLFVLANKKIAYKRAQYFWPFNVISKTTRMGYISPDIKGGKPAIMRYGSRLVISSVRRNVGSTNRGFVTLGNFANTVYSNPTVKRTGFTVMFWVRMNPVILAKGRTDKYIISSGAQSRLARGFAMAFSKGKYKIKVTSAYNSWNLAINPNKVPKSWFHLAFSWRKDLGLTLYINSKQVGIFCEFAWYIDDESVLRSSPMAQISFCSFLAGRSCISSSTFEYSSSLWQIRWDHCWKTKQLE